VTAPTKLAVGSIGGLKVRSPDPDMAFLNMLIYGISGVGKTLLAGTSVDVEQMSPILVIDAEEGSLTLNALAEQTDRISVLSMREWKRMQSVYDDLYTGKHPYRTVVIDSGTEVQQLAMNDVLGTDGKVLDIGITPEFKDWYKNTEQIRRMIRAFRDLPMHTIVTALEADYQDPRTKALMKRPAFSNKLSQQIPAFFDAVFYMYVKEVSGDRPNLRLCLTDKTDRVVAKCRTQGVPQVIENPTMPVIFDYLIRRGANNK
jgi:AAA domain